MALGRSAQHRFMGELGAMGKQELVRINQSESDKARKSAYPLLDFSGYNSITTETVPTLDSYSPMQWYSSCHITTMLAVPPRWGLR